MLYDTHAHFFTNDVSRFPIDPSGARGGADALRQRVLTAPSTPEAILGGWDRNGVTGGTGVQYNSTYKTDNSYLLSVRDAHKDRVSAVVILDPQDPATPDALQRMADEHGITGIRMTGFPDNEGRYPYFESQAALATWAAAERLGIAVVLMYLPGRSPSETALSRIAELAGRFPQLSIVLDHCGWPAPRTAPNYGFGAAHKALTDRKNVFFKITTINFEQLAQADIDSAQFVRHAVDLYGADRIMWGSDFGNTEGTFEDMVARARQSTRLLTPQESRAVLHDTGSRIFSR